MDDIEVVEFITKNRKYDVDAAERMIKRAFVEYVKGTLDIYKEIAKGLDDIEKAELNKEIENGECSEWENKLTELQLSIEDKYNVSIDHNDINLTISKQYAGLLISYSSTVYDKEGKQGNFEYTLDADTDYMVDLIKFIVKDEIKRNEHTIIGGR